ncbi:MAG: type III-B CRISPR module RAMP protein Cmr4 [Deltaproteobacteria bacterium]|nr:type III-B CRISPR module RAMP protein Cmr4 [Deltaproteobacteria bacterium]
MYLIEHAHLCVLHAISPVHAGSGSALGAVDLPIQRERHTGWPHIQASGVKGAFRDHCERVWMTQQCKGTGNDDNKKQQPEELANLANRIFGMSESTESQAGAIAFSDAKLLAFPVRSNLAPFVWVVCPALLKRLSRDLELVGIPQVRISAEVLDSVCVSNDQYRLVKGEINKNDSLILEDICLTANNDEWNKTELEETFNRLAPEIERLVVIPDAHFSFLMETATEIQAQIKIKPETGTTQDGSLRYQELLPAESVLYTLVFFTEERTKDDANKLQLDILANHVKYAASTYIQMGGDMTLGRGIFKIKWLSK